MALYRLRRRRFLQVHQNSRWKELVSPSEFNRVEPYAAGYDRTGDARGVETHCISLHKRGGTEGGYNGLCPNPLRFLNTRWHEMLHQMSVKWQDIYLSYILILKFLRKTAILISLSSKFLTF